VAGIHAGKMAGLEEEALQGWFGRQSHRPVYAMPHLAW
jgi:hypothetical protein